MHYFVALLLLAALLPLANAQSAADTLPPAPRVRVWPQKEIAACRHKIMEGFLAEDRAEVQFWIDSLQRLESDYSFGLYWDERWLLYLWLENYAPVFEEVVLHNKIAQLEQTRIPPPKDSLFQVIDQSLFEARFALFDRLNRAWLSAEDRAFGSLLISYLLRLDITEEEQTAFDARLDTFLSKYPQSRFRPFILERMYYTPRPDDWGMGFDLSLNYGEWSGPLGRTLNAPFGGELSFFVVKKRWIGGVRAGLGGMRLRRTIVYRGFEWYKDDPANFVFGELEAGYLFYQKGRAQIGPLLAGGLSSVRPSLGREEEFPFYYEEAFRFNGWHLTAGLQADWVFTKPPDVVGSSFSGLRLRFGYRWLHLSKGSPDFRGDQFFFSVGWVIFGRQILSGYAN